MFIYLASPYTPLPLAGYTALPEELSELKEERFQLVCKKAAQLMENGHLVFCPIAHSHPIEKYGMDEVHSGEFWLEQDYAVLKCVDEVWVLMLPGYDKSKGIAAEMQFADSMGIPVYYLKPDQLYPEACHGTTQEAIA